MQLQRQINVPCGKQMPQKQRGVRSHRTTRRHNTEVYRNDGKNIQNEIYEPQSLFQAPYTQKADRTFKPNIGPQR